MKQIASITQIEELVEFLQQNNLQNVVWEVVGGYPAQYNNLNEIFIDMKLEGSSTSDMIKEMKKFVVFQLLKAHDNIVSGSSNTKAIVKIFRDKVYI